LAVKVKIKKKTPTLTPDDFAVPGDRSARQMAYLSFVVVSLILIGIASSFGFRDQNRSWIPAIAVTVWVIVPWWIFYILLPRRYRSRIGLKNRAMPTHHPEIRDLVSRQARMLGVKEPEVFVIDDEVGWIKTFSAGRPYIVVTKPIIELLKPAEFACAVLRELGKIKSGHVRAFSLLHFMGSTPRFLRGIFCMPVWFLHLLLWQNWEDEAEETLDRLLLIYTRNARLCASTILKMEVERDPVVNISPDEVEDYLRQHDPLQATSLQVSAHFKMGTTIHDKPELNERLKSFVVFTQSDDYKNLVQKLKEVVESQKPRK